MNSVLGHLYQSHLLLCSIITLTITLLKYYHGTRAMCVAAGVILIWHFEIMNPISQRWVVVWYESRKAPLICDRTLGDDWQPVLAALADVLRERRRLVLIWARAGAAIMSQTVKTHRCNRIDRVRSDPVCVRAIIRNQKSLTV